MYATSSSRPLAGRRIAVTRPLAQSGELADGLRARGAEPVVHPAIAIATCGDASALDAAITRLGDYAWIAVTSANGARALGERLTALGATLPESVRLAAVGPATAAALARAVGAPEIVATEHEAGSLARAIPVALGDRVLLPRGELAGDALPAALRARGATVDEIIAYRTVPGPGLDALATELAAGVLDAVLFTSASAARFTAEALARAGGEARRAAIFCLGEATAAEARSRGFDVVGVADPHTVPALLHCVAAWFAARDR